MNLTCRDVMLKEQTVLSPDDSISKAFQLIKKEGMRYLPVVDKDNTYIGVFTSPTLIRVLLPKAITIELAGMETDWSLKNLTFFNINHQDFYKRLNEIKDDKVIDYLSDKKNIPVVSPDTPIMEGVLLLDKYKRHVILVDQDSNKFVGVLTINSVLGHIFSDEEVVGE